MRSPAADTPAKPQPGAATIIGPKPGLAATDQAEAKLPTSNLSFVRNIAPILVAKCAKCHINATKGKFSMATFEALKKGTPDGSVFAAGNGANSQLVMLIASGDMPRAGPK